MLLVQNLFSQSAVLNGKIFDGQINIGFPAVTLILIDKDDKTYGAVTNIDGYYEIQNLQIGVYTLKITSTGVGEKIIENFTIQSKEQTFDLIYPEPCLKTNKLCPKKHKDHIIPIVYGLPSKQMMIKSKKGKIKLGGCNPSFCKKWYCKIHNISF